MMTIWAEEFSKIHPNVQFDVQGGGAGKLFGRRGRVVEWTTLRGLVDGQQTGIEDAACDELDAPVPAALDDGLAASIEECPASRQQQDLDRQTVEHRVSHLRLRRPNADAANEALFAKLQQRLTPNSVGWYRGSLT